MNDADFEVQCARVKALVDQWQQRLGLGAWRISVKCRREPFTEPGNEKAVMLCDASWQYHDVLIRANALETAELDDEHLEWSYLHELGHVFLNELRPVTTCCKDSDWLLHEEHVASLLAYSWQWTRDGARDAQGTEAVDA